MASPENVTFTLTVTMGARWVPHFLGMLRYMQHLGNIGSSRRVSLYADGDGDFRPKFAWDASLKSDALPVTDTKGDRLYDAG